MRPFADRLYSTFGTLLLMVCMTATPVAAQSAPASPLAEVLDLSGRLYVQGIATQDPVIVLAAARLRLSRFTAELGPEANGWTSGSAMLASAEILAAEDPALRALISRQHEDISRGGLDGPQVVSTRVPGKGQVRLSHAFKGGLPAYVYAEGSLSARLSVTVMVEDTAVCRTPVETGRALCRWIAADDRGVTTIVSNLSAEDTTILVVTN